MASNINAALPAAGIAYTADMRSNFAAAKAEIEALQGRADAFQAVNKAFLAATDIIDICAYDTRLDDRLPDGGRWNEPARCSHTSWYQEAQSATRGAKRDFPLVALIIAQSGSFKIYDALDLDVNGLPRLWMVFTRGYYGKGWVPITGIAALNGRIYVSSNNGSGNGEAYVYDFPNDVHYFFDPSGRKTPNNFRIVDRNIGATAVSTVAAQALPSGACNGIAARVLPGAPLDQSGLPIPTIAVATAAGTSVVHPSGQVASISISGGSSRVLFRDDASLMVATATDVGVWSCSVPYATRSLGAGDFQYRPSNNTAGLYPVYLTASPGAARLAPGAIGSDNGLALIAQDATAPGNGMVAYATTAYATGWQPGDIRLATLCDSAVGSVIGTGTELFPDGSFAGGSAAGWSGNGAAAAVVSGALRIATTAAFGRCTYPLATVAGQSYLVRLDVLGTSSTPAYVQVGTAPFGTDLKGAQVFAAGTLGALVEFTAVGAASYLTVGASYGNPVANVDIDNLSCRPSAADRSYKGKGLWTFGTLTRAPVATGAEMQGWSGWSAGSYLFQPANSDLDFGTGDFCVIAWLVLTSATTGWVLDHRAAAGTGAGFYCAINSSGAPFIAVTDGASYPMATGAAMAVGVPTQVAWLRRAGVLELWQNGVLVSTAINGAYSVTNGQATTIGVTSALNTPFPGSISMLRVAAGAPTPAQLRRIFADESALVQAGAWCFLGGTSNAVADLDYDPITGRHAVGTGDGVSIFRGLRRVDYKDATALANGAMTSDNVKAVSLRAGSLLIGTDATAGVVQDAISTKEAALTPTPQPAPRPFVARGVTTDATPTDLTPRVSVGERELVVITATVLGRVYGASDGQRSKYVRRGTFYRDSGGALTLQGSVEVLGTDTEVTTTADATLNIDAAAQTVSVRVTGVASARVVWQAVLDVQRISEDQTYA